MTHALERSRGHIAPTDNLAVGDDHDLNPAALREGPDKRTSLLRAKPRGVPQISPLPRNGIHASRDRLGIVRDTGSGGNHLSTSSLLRIPLSLLNSVLQRKPKEYRDEEKGGAQFEARLTDCHSPIEMQSTAAWREIQINDEPIPQNPERGSNVNEHVHRVPTSHCLPLRASLPPCGASAFIPRTTV